MIPRPFGLTIYSRPLDFPEKVVVRGWDLPSKIGLMLPQTLATARPIVDVRVFLFDELEMARDWVEGLGYNVVIARDKSDPASVVESWI